MKPKYIQKLVNSRFPKLSNTSIRILFGIVIGPLVVLATASIHQFDDEKPVPNINKELEAFKIADGFEVTLFASDPMVAKPIQMNWDEDGRLWVVSSTAYPHLKTGEIANDKIFVLEDTDGDGKADKSTIFAEGLMTPTGILPGDGGVYVANSTEILFLADTNGDGKADSRRQVLTGFGTGDTHHLIHTFRWGPEGRLYFNQSIYIYSHVETPFGTKRLEGGGVWKLNPKTLELDVYARGLVNPWGLQFDKWGQSFLTDGAGDQGINYAFPGATFVTALGAERTIRGLNPGQPKHCGLDIISGSHLPESWQGNIITNDFRANRINRFKLEEQGSGYISKQVEDLLWTDNIAFRPVDVSVGPDGAIYVADWYNPIIQHGEVDFHDPRRDQQHGRIWRIVAKDKALVKVPKLSKASISELLDALKAPEDWTRLQAKQVLKNRDAKDVIPALEKWISSLNKTDANYEHQKLEALWVYQSLDVFNQELLNNLLDAKSHNARAAALRALQLWHHKIPDVQTILSKAITDQHPQVRLEAVIALRSLKTAEAERIALMALDQPMDEFLDFALWQTTRDLEPIWLKKVKDEPAFLGDAKKTVYALKSVSDTEVISQLVQLYQQNQVPDEYEQDVLNSIAKYGEVADLNALFNLVIQGSGKHGKSVAKQLATLEDVSRQRNLKPDQPLNHIATFLTNDDEAIATSAIRLTGLWKLESLNDQLVNLIHKGNKNIKKTALGSLVSIGSDQSIKSLVELTSTQSPPDLRLLAIAQLVNVDVNEASNKSVDLLKTLPAQTDATELFQALLANKESVNAFSSAVNTKKIPESFAKAARKTMQRHLSANRNNDEDVKNLKKALEASGGILPPERTPQQPNDREIANLANEVKGMGNPILGEAVFRNKTLSCQPCHAIGGAGGRIGPDLSSLGTSSTVETIIRSILYPNQSIKEGFEMKKVIKIDGSEVLGYMVSDGSSEAIIRDISGEEVAIAKAQIKVIEKVPGSLMPPRLTTNLNKDEFINLVAFLSRIGETGTLRVPNERYVRRWRTIGANKELGNKLSAGGLDLISKADTKVQEEPLYSKVSGELPINDLPTIKVNNKHYSFVKFDLEILNKGNVRLALNTSSGLSAWSGQNALKFTNNDLITHLPQGVQQITLAIDRSVIKDGVLSIQLQDANNDVAQTRLVMGL